MAKFSNRSALSAITVALILTVIWCAGCSYSHAPLTSGKESAEAGSFSYLSTTQNTGDISVSAHSAILMEAECGSVLWQKNADDRMAMASTTKIMTALVALENLNMAEIVTVSPDAVGIEGSSIYLFAGEKISAEHLLYALLLSSANDAAAALAIEVGGSIEGFADMMNQKASELGLKDTHFVNPHGLYDEQHYTTARELAVIAREAMKNEHFAKIVSTYKKTAALDGEDGVRLFVNHNKLLRSYEGACGVKTGFTKKSGRCLVSCAERDGVKLLCVTLNAPDDWRDHKALLDYGFSVCESRVLCPDGGFELNLPVVGGTSDCVTVCNAHEIRLTSIGTFPEVTHKVELDRFVFATIEQGEILGRIVYYVDGKEVAECPLVAQYSVSQKIYKKDIWGRLFR